MAQITIGDSVVFFDDEDAPRVEGFAWRILKRPHTQTGYAVAKVDGRRRLVQMHRVILGSPSGVVVDHRNGNGLDNRRANLRECTHAQNLWNSGAHRDSRSGIKGVSLDPTKRGDKKFKASITAAGDRMHLGWYLTAEQAGAAYALAAYQFHGEYSRID